MNWTKCNYLFWGLDGGPRVNRGPFGFPGPPWTARGVIEIQILNHSQHRPTVEITHVSAHGALMRARVIANQHDLKELPAQVESKRPGPPPSKQITLKRPVAKSALKQRSLGAWRTYMMEKEEGIFRGLGPQYVFREGAAVFKRFDATARQRLAIIVAAPMQQTAAAAAATVRAPARTIDDQQPSAADGLPPESGDESFGLLVLVVVDGQEESALAPCLELRNGMSRIVAQERAIVAQHAAQERSQTFWLHSTVVLAKAVQA